MRLKRTDICFIGRERNFIVLTWSDQSPSTQIKSPERPHPYTENNKPMEKESSEISQCLLMVNLGMNGKQSVQGPSIHKYHISSLALPPKRTGMSDGSQGHEAGFNG